MKLKDYLQDKIVSILLYIVLIAFVQFMLYMFRVPETLMISIMILMLLFMVIVVLYDYNRKKVFFNDMLHNIELLDKKYLITELVKRPNFIEGQLFHDFLYEIDKSMYEEIELYKGSVNDFKEYIEMWIHEVKLPISSSVLILHNNKPDGYKKLKPQIDKIENYVDQVLYYVRSENAEKDYLIKHCKLQEIINNVIRKNKDSLILKHISIEIDKANKIILSDGKWVEFILNQIVSNSIKYAKDKNPHIIFKTKNVDNKIILCIEDNGLGISESDLPRVFEKSFTGENGRTNVNSTGMGLYLSKKLCYKLGHSIHIESKKDSFTRVSITFISDEYYSDVR